MTERAEWGLCVDGPAIAGNLPRSPGAYLLVIDVASPLSLCVGRLGGLALAPGRYVYVGSARGPGGLAARVTRHLSSTRRPHWHIDALTALAPVVRVYAVVSSEPSECAWVRWLLAQPGTSAPIAGFGSSDCRSGCPAHLLRIAEELEPGQWHGEGWELRE